MAYTLTTWTENMGSTASVAALDNLETIYTEAIAYIDAITHSATYYNKTEIDAKYITSATDGSGTGVICEKLDGMTAQQIIDSGTPPRCIAIWSGDEGSIPSGWFLCNGYNGTPNLLSRFIVSAGGNYPIGSTGGNGLVTVTGSVTIAGHSLTEGEVPKHAHGSITDYYGTANTSQYATSGGYHYGYNDADHDAYTEYAGSGASHTHTASFTGTSNQDKRPPYYALCYIMKSE